MFPARKETEISPERQERKRKEDEHEDLKRDVVGKDGLADRRLTVLCGRIARVEEGEGRQVNESGMQKERTGEERNGRISIEIGIRDEEGERTTTGDVRRRGVELGEEETSLRTALVADDVTGDREAVKKEVLRRVAKSASGGGEGEGRNAPEHLLAAR